MGEIAKSFFGPGTPGLVMMGLLLAGVITFIGERFLVTLGRGNWAVYFKTGMELAAIGAVVAIALKMLGTIFALSQGSGF